MLRRPYSPKHLLPHIVTFLRVPFAVAFMVAFGSRSIGGAAVSLALLGLAALSDYLDGMLARRLDAVSEFGKWADPLCDALFFLAVYISFYRASLIPLPLLVLFGIRECAQYGAVRPLSTRRGIDPGARLPGKIKTGLQMGGTALILLLDLARAAGALPEATLVAAASAVVALLVAVSLGSLYWYVVPLLAPPPSARLALSIGASVGAQLVVNMAALVAIGRFAPAAAASPPLLIAAVAAYHVLVALLLLRRRDDLAAADGSSPGSLNIASQLTLWRFTTAPTFALAIVSGFRSPAAAACVLTALSLVFLTDLADGRLARARGEETFMGRYLDPVSDYVLLFATVIAGWAAGAIATWYLAVFAARFAIFPVLMGALSWKRRRVEPESTFLGKVAVFAAMATLAFQLCRAFRVPAIGLPAVVTSIEIATACILSVSLVEKIGYVMKRLRGA
jgi:CDP-diacylglycerol---glycerol-3-phosphate 3-phosphatidyltransferase